MHVQTNEAKAMKQRGDPRSQGSKFILEEERKGLARVYKINVCDTRDKTC